ncbi:TetR/AcrR family transcriptional regulator [Streptomyces violaceusniger]|uniref:TetR family transcriptional regulator n=1 Tax=Streptomyces violaceusniger TaxID=68280 RepID=A0A4D4KL96_STRVO|nr:TetR family transcriptional regulator [Streptomyces violaceusniger]
MPRITQEEKAHNRRNIVAAAARLFRLHGIDGVGIADLMKEAGLTHGGFYNHFPSKDALAVEVCRAAFEQSLGTLDAMIEAGATPEGTPLERAVAVYLSTDHRDHPDGGCPSSSLIADAGRDGESVQGAYAEGVDGYLAGFTAELIRMGLSEQDARARAIRLLSELIGSMMLARAVREVRPQLSDEILGSVRAQALQIDHAPN